MRASPSTRRSDRRTVGRVRSRLRASTRDRYPLVSPRDGARAEARSPRERSRGHLLREPAPPCGLSRFLPRDGDALRQRADDHPGGLQNQSRRSRRLSRNARSRGDQRTSAPCSRRTRGAHPRARRGVRTSTTRRPARWRAPLRVASDSALASPGRSTRSVSGGTARGRLGVCAETTYRSRLASREWPRMRWCSTAPAATSTRFAECTRVRARCSTRRSSTPSRQMPRSCSARRRKTHVPKFSSRSRRLSRSGTRTSSATSPPRLRTLPT